MHIQPHTNLGSSKSPLFIHECPCPGAPLFFKVNNSYPKKASRIIIHKGHRLTPPARPNLQSRGSNHSVRPTLFPNNAGRLEEQKISSVKLVLLSVLNESSVLVISSSGNFEKRVFILYILCYILFCYIYLVRYH